MLTHEAYLDALQAIRSTSIEWRGVLAGLLVLRLIDAWLDDDGHLVPRDGAALTAVREVLTGVKERDPVLAVLSELVQIVTESEHALVSSITTPLLEYGEILHRTDRWWLAMDVFASLLSHAQANRDALTSVRAASRLAFILRELGQLDAAQSAYQLSIDGSLRIGRLDLHYLAVGGLATTIAADGRFQESRDLFKEIISKTRQLGLTQVYARSLHGLASLVMGRQDYATAFQIGQVAFLHTPAAQDKELVLANNAGALVGLGDHRRAKEILITQLDNTHFEVTRQRALLNLLEIAAKEMNKSEFDRYRQELDGTLVLPDIRMHYHHFVGKGYYFFKTPAAAMEEWKNALAIAEENHLTQSSRLIQSEVAAMIGHPLAM